MGSRRRDSETAAAHLVRRVPTASADETAGEVRGRLAGQAFEYAGLVCVLGHDRRLDGVVRLERLLGASTDVEIRALMDPAPHGVHPDTDQETLASVAARNRLTALPVVDGAQRLVGVVPGEALLAILRREHLEDLHRLVGIRRDISRARDALEEPPTHRARHRLPWLLVGLAGTVVAALVMAAFERALSAQIRLAFFVPGIVYLADAIGTQTETVVVRGLSMSRVRFARLLAGELRTGLVIGAVLGALGIAASYAAFRDAGLSLTVGVAILASGAVATTVGLLLPWALHRSGRDPALGSGPLATIVQDVLTLLIYFLAAAAFS